MTLNLHSEIWARGVGNVTEQFTFAASIVSISLDINLHFEQKFQLNNTCAKNSIMLPVSDLNLLKPTGHVMHQQFNIQQLYALPTLYLCVLYLSEDKQRLAPLTA